MAGRIRSIKPEVLDDEVASMLSDEAWRLWVSTWVLADDQGNVRAGAKYLAASVWQDTARDATRPLKELVDKGFFRAYAVKGQRYAHINGWERHQRIDNAGKPRVPGPDEDDGTWDQQLSGLFAYSRGDPPRAAATSGEPPLARAPAQSGGETSDLRSPTPTPTADAASGVLRVVPDSEPGSAPPPTGFLGRGMVNVQRPFWVAAYERAVTETRGEQWDFPPKAFSALVTIIERRCHGENRRRIEQWLDSTVRAFVLCVLDARVDPLLWSSFGPDGMQRWFNASCKIDRGGPKRAGGGSDDLSEAEKAVAARRRAAQAGA